jgi:HK97 gp10 family phage protein
LQIRTTVDIDELLANIDKLPEALKNALAGAMEIATELVEADAAERCPKQSTALSTSITHEVVESETEIRGFVGSIVEHAPYVHEGTGLYAADGNGRKDVPWVYCDERGNFHTTSGQKPQPFLQEAADANRNKILQCFEGVLGR